jgi:hypothetical protein
MQSTLRLIGAIHGTRKLERQVHNSFAKLRSVGEWFRWTEELNSHITRLLNQ